MNRITTATRGICSWRERLADPGGQWRRCYSAFEAAVSWELAANTESGLPEQIQNLLESEFGTPQLLLAVAEHKVPLAGGNKDSQNDLWGLVKTSSGTVSLSVEAKAKEPFGDQTVSTWLSSGKSDRSRANREARWQHLHSQLPKAPDGAYEPVAYQLVHRCASAVIEARRFGLKHAACIVQAFNTPQDRFEQFSIFCKALGVSASRGSIHLSKVDDVKLAIGWADCPLATDQQIAAIAG